MRVLILLILTVTLILMGCNTKIEELNSNQQSLAKEYQIEIPKTPVTTTEEFDLVPPPPIYLSKELIPDLSEIINKYKNQFYEREYTWTYGLYVSKFKIRVPKAYYIFFKSLPRTRYYSAYVTNPYDDPILEQYVKEIERVAKQHGLSKSQIADLVISFVQSLKYTSDKVTTGYDEYPRYPLETLVDEGGDCEDTAILTASLLQQMGFDVVLFKLPRHMAVGIWVDKPTPGSYVVVDGKRYYYLETTGSGWKVGQAPKEFQHARVEVIKLNPSPLLAIKKWSIRASSADKSWVYYVVEVYVANFGKVPSVNTICKVSVVDMFNRVYSTQSKSVAKIDKYRIHRYVLFVKSPWNKSLRLKIDVWSDNHPLITVYSDWFEPKK